MPDPNDTITVDPKIADPKVDAPVDDSGSDNEWETYNGFKVQKGATEVINKRVASETFKLKEKYRTLQEQMNETNTRLEEMKLASMSDKERLEHEAAVRKAKEDQLLSKVSETDSKFKSYFRDTELLKAIGDYDCISPRQVLNLIKAEYKIDYVDNDGEVGIVFKNGDEALTVKDAVKTFLADPSNSNLVRSTLKPGSGTKTSSTPGSAKLRTVFTRAEVADTKSEAAKEYQAALKARLNPKLV